MKYIKFKIKNYKGIPEIVLDLDKKPNSNIFTLVGLNESGKTSILEAIYLFQRDIPKEETYTLIPKSRQYGFTGCVSIEATLQLDSADTKIIRDFLQTKYKFNLENDNEVVKIEKKYNFVKSLPADGENWMSNLWTTLFIGKTNKAKKTTRLIEWNKDAWKDLVNFIEKSLMPKILYYPDFLFKFPEKIYLEEFDKEGSEQREYRSVIKDILESIDKNLNLEEDLLNRMKNSNDRANKDSLNQLLLKISAKLNSEILKEWDEIFGSGQEKEVDISWSSESVGEVDRYFIELKIKQGSASYSINDRSLGFRWFFSFLIFTAFRKSRSSDPGETLFLLDEPASNLHQRSQQKLLKSLDKIISDCKLIYSTHSHHMINPKWLSGAYIVRNESINYGNPEEARTSETEINATLYKNFVAKYPEDVDHFKPILDSLQYVPSNLEVVPYTVFTEGKNDYYTYKYLSEIVLKNKFDLHFYPGAGVSKYADVFRLYLAWSRIFISVFDADAGGKKERKRYINEIGPDVEKRVFCLDQIDTTWSEYTTESLFSENEKIKIIQTAFPEHKLTDGYSKSKFNTAIQQLYIDEKNFDFEKETILKFKKIFSFVLTAFESL